MKEKEISELNVEIINNNEPDPDVKTNSDSETNEAQISQKPILSYLRRKFILEPPIFLIYFGISLSSTVFQNQLLYQSCTAVFQYSVTECAPLRGTENSTPSQKIEQDAQLYTSHIAMAFSMVESILPAIISLFIGPWSDEFGRHPALIITVIGFILRYVIGAILALMAPTIRINPWLYIISPIPSSICGGTCAIMIVAYCYIADVASAEQKALRMVLNSAALGVGSLVGTVVSGYLYKATNMATVFGISFLSMVAALIYIIFVNKESLNVQYTPLSKKLRRFFNINHVVELIRSCVVKRENYQRTFIWLTMIALVITNFTEQGESNIFYLFLRQKFSVTVTEYSTYNAVAIVIQMVGGIIALILLRKYLHFSLITISMLSLFCSVVESTIRAAAQQFWEMYLAVTLGFMSGITAAMLITTLAFIAPATETGKIFSLTISLQTLSPLGAAPLYTSVYDATLSTYPGLFNIISALLYLVGFVCLAVILGLAKRNGITVSPPPRQKASSSEKRTP